jgi:hypothetical protein
MAYWGRMTEPQRISTLLTQIHQGPAWHGPSLRETLEGVDAKLASRRPFPNAHTIWELVLHLTAWLDIFQLRVMDKQSLDVSKEMDWPRMPSPTEENWQRSLAALFEAEKKASQMALDIPVERYEESIEGDPAAPLYIVLNGLIAHTAYHAGQIAVLKK